jgi:LPS export ABC transporter protein LptC
MLVSCQQNEKVKVNIVDVAESGMPDQICHNLNIAFIDSSNTKAVIKAKRARIYNDSNYTLLDSGVYVRFFNSFGQESGTLTANNMKIDDKTKDMYATGNVVVNSYSRNSTLTSEALDWKNATKKIYSTVYVKIVSPTETIEGVGLESDDKLENYKIYKVSGIKQ